MKCEKCGIDIEENETLCEKCKEVNSMEVKPHADAPVIRDEKKKKKHKVKKSPNVILAKSIFAFLSPNLSIFLFFVMAALTLLIQLVLDFVFTGVNALPVIGQVVYVIVFILVSLLSLVPFLVTGVFSLWAAFFSMGTIFSASLYRRRYDDSNTKMTVSKIFAVLGFFVHALIAFVGFLPIILALVVLSIIIILALAAVVISVVGVIISVIASLVGAIVFAIFLIVLIILGIINILSQVLEIANVTAPLFSALYEFVVLISSLIGIAI